MEEFELESGEQVVRTVRLHPFVLGLRLLPFVVLAFIPAILGAFLSFFAAMSPASSEAFSVFQIPPHVLRFFTGVWLLGLWTAAFGMLTQYHLTVWVITNLRIVDIKQHSFFNREVSSFLLIRVQDVTTQTSGLLGTLIGFGRLSVETAGKDENFTMDGIGNPEGIRDVIMSQVTDLHHSDVTGGI